MSFIAKAKVFHTLACNGLGQFIINKSKCIFKMLLKLIVFAYTYNGFILYIYIYFFFFQIKI